MKDLCIAICILLLATTSGASEQQEAAKDLELLCRNEPVELTRISQIRDITKLLQSGTSNSDCSQEMKDALSSLNGVIADHSEDVCTMQKVDQIRDFHLRYISTSDGQNSGSLPKALRYFFLGFGLKVSLVCKKNMINSLILDTERNLSAEDFAWMKKWTNSENGVISQILDNPSDYDDLISMKDFIRFSNPTSDEKIFIQTASSNLLKQIQMTCLSRFKPFYEKLILPLVELSNIGYNYQGEELQRELSELSTNSQVQQWYRITYLCSSLEDIELVTEPEDATKTEGLDRSLVKILSKQEAAELKTKGGVSLTEFKVDDSEKIVYKLEYGNAVEDLVIDRNDNNLNSLLGNFDTQKSESDRVKLRLFRKIGKFLKETLKKGQIKIAASIFGSNKGGQTSKNSLIEALDEYIEQTTDSFKSDSPVSGLRSYGQRVYHEAAYLGVPGLLSRAHYEAKPKLTICSIFYYALGPLLLIIGILMFASIG